MKTKIVLAAGLLLLTLACDKATSTYSKLDADFESNRWLQADVKTHEFAITDDAKTYDLVLRFSHVYDYQFASVPMTITITAPSGQQEKKDILLQIKDGSGKQLGDCSGDVCDLEMNLKEKAQLEKGTYKVSLTHTFQGPYLPNVLGVGLDVRAAQ